MKTYKIYGKNGETIAVKQGWSWTAFFFSWLWAFTKKLMLAGIIGLLCNAFMVPFGIAPYVVIGGIIFGWKGNQWWQDKLIKNGYTFQRTVQASNQQQALQTQP